MIQSLSPYAMCRWRMSNVIVPTTNSHIDNSFISHESAIHAGLYQCKHFTLN
ncbi:hypothetical protein DERF_001660 [Dermatophagoides farinae]|uniref:Uncharacterized protein n=1 Tax=Dermatophagoides farinae TaxID=6954 RepID=A0A922IB97_DERFA|nr:hypothetical protein DERF_001660 [Dermatophagoides farinae]